MLRDLLEKSRARRLQRARARRFNSGDPLASHHVLRRDREKGADDVEDTGPGGSIEREDLEWYKENPGDFDDLQ